MQFDNDPKDVNKSTIGWLKKKRKNQAVPMDQPKPDPTEMFRINKCLQTLMNNIIKKGPTFVHNNDRD